MSTKSDFFTARSFAVVGDTSTRKFPALTRRYLEEQGKTVYAVDLAGGRPGFLASLDDVPADTEAAIVEVAKERTAAVVQAVLDRGISRIWIHQATDTPEALALCRTQGAEVHTGGCAVMYNAPTTSPHGLHRGIWKLIGRY